MVGVETYVVGGRAGVARVSAALNWHGRDNTMLTMTEAAGDHLQTLLEKSNAPDDAALRFVPGQQGLEITMDKPRDNDQQLEHAGRTVLLLDEQLAEKLDGHQLDAKQTEQGTALTLQAQSA